MIEANLPVAIIGGGPIGLAAAAHVLARGETPLVLEAGATVGHTVRQWSHVAMFSPWQFLTDPAAVALLTASGWSHPPRDTIPTGAELVARYLEPLAALPALRPHIRLGTRVIAVTRKGLDKVRTAGRDTRPFTVRVETDGRAVTIDAKAVIDASGTWTSPNPAGSDGLPATGELAASDNIFYGIPDVLGRHRHLYADRTVMVVGSGHSAINALIELDQLRQQAPRTSIVWILRKATVDAAFGGEAADALPARGALGIRARQLVASGAVEAVSPFHVAAMAPHGDGRLTVTDETGRAIVTDRVIVATGFRPDFAFLREIRLSLDPWLESSGTLGPLIDPNLHSCGTVRPHGAAALAHAEPDFFIVGMKSYGRAPTFLLATGHEQVRSVVAALVGDHAAAARVELTLPKTGVCSAPAAPKPSAQPEAALAVAGADRGCCGGPAPAEIDACCALDAQAKASGDAGCGCGADPEPLVIEPASASTSACCRS
ncbi:MAG: NAD(P)-binding domain-containing protein [Proteobacteria bacterium]|nr:NAD(P)-binding domain-containing protein [Pseudomonadota bacterium]